MGRSITAIALVLPLSACAGTTSLESVSPTAMLESGFDLKVVPQDMRTVLARVAATKDEFQQYRRTKRSVQTAFDSSLIALASATVSAAFFGATPDLVGGLGLGAGAITAYRGYYNPAGERNAYASGYFALECLEFTAQPLLSATPDDLSSARRTLANAIANARTTAAALSVANTGASPALAGQPMALAVVDTARGMDAAAEAIGAAEAALRALDGEITAYTLAPYHVARGYNSILARVDAATARTSVDVSATQTSLVGSITAATNAAATAADARAKLTQALKSTATEKAQVPGAGTVVTTPETPAPLVMSGATPLEARRLNIGYVAGLNEATEQALNRIPIPAYTSITTSILACAAAS